MKYPKRQERDKQSPLHENLNDKFLKDYQMIHKTLNEFIYHFQQDLNGPASTLILIEKKSIMKEDTLWQTRIHETITLKESVGPLKN